MRVPQQPGLRLPDHPKNNFSAHTDSGNQEETKMDVTVERDSVCMADDCNAPNTKILQVSGDLYISQFLKQLTNAMPSVADPEPIVWSVHLGQRNGRAIGLIETVYQVRSRVTVLGSDLKMHQSGIGKVYCRYYCKSSLMKPDQNGHLCIPMYPECQTLAEKVKKHLSAGK